MITDRGNPDAPTVDGKEQESVHFRFTDFRLDPSENQQPLCSTGAWNIRWTNTREEVTCQACKAKLERL